MALLQDKNSRLILSIKKPQLVHISATMQKLKKIYKNQSINEPRQAPNLKVGKGGKGVFSPNRTGGVRNEN